MSPRRRACRPARVAAACCVAALIVVSPEAVSGQQVEAADSLLTAREAQRRAAESSRPAPELQAAQPRGALLAHVLGHGRLVPDTWVVYLEGAEGRPAGLVGLDPRTGDYRFESYLAPRYQFPEFRPDRVRDVLQSHGIDPAPYDLEDPRFAFFGGKAKGNFWVVPHASGELADYLAVPAYGRNLHKYLEVQPLLQLESGLAYYRLGDGVLAEARKQMIDEPPASDPVFSLGADTAGKSGPSLPDGDPSSGGPAVRKLHAGPRSDGNRASRVLPGREAQGGPRPASSRRAGRRPAAKDVSIKDDVPVYSQGDTNLCGKYVLAMTHQWWSPIDLGTGESQVDEIMAYLNHSHEWTMPPAVKKVMNHWNQVDGSYQDFQTTWSGEAPKVHTGSPNGKSDDIKSWIHYLDAPVLVLGDSDGNNTLGWSVDHWVAVTGYDDSKKKLYYNTSGAYIGSCSGWCGYRHAISYSTWNNRFAPHNRAAMVAGYPGDRTHAEAASGRSISAGRIDDDERLHVFPVEIEPVWDGAAEGSVSFGRNLESTVTLTIDGGWFENATRGGFDGATIDSNGRRTVFSHTSGLSQGSSPRAAEVRLDPFEGGKAGGGALGADTITARRVVHDEDDRVHASKTITLTRWQYDRSGKNGKTNMQMPPAVLRPDTAVREVAFRVDDDDTSGPHFANRRPASQSSIADANWPSGGLGVRADVADASGLQEVRFHYEIEDLPSGRSVATGSGTVATHGSGTYRYDIPRRDWFDHDKVTWWVEATDDDSDRAGDRASGTSIKFAFYLTDDDTTGPRVKAARDTFTTVTQGSRKIRRYTLQVRLQDPSGVANTGTSPRVYYRQKPGLPRGRTPAVDDTLKDGTLPMRRSGSWWEATVADTVRRQGGVFNTLYWRVKARDADSDRPDDGTVGWSPVYSADRPRTAGKLCVSPDPPSHDFGTISTTGSTSKSWSFTVENCGGERAKRITVFKRLSQSLQQPTTGRRPNCPHGASGCWLNVGGIGRRGERLYGGDTVHVPVKVDVGGLDYQVSPLPPGRYEAVVRILKGQTSVRGTLRVAVPDSTGDVPEPDAAEDGRDDDGPYRIPRDPWAGDGACYLGFEGGAERTDLGTPGSEFSTDAATSPLAGLVVRCDVTGPLGLQTGGYYVERGGTLEGDLATTVEAGYLDVPLLLTAAIPTGSAVRPRLYAGPTAGIELSCDARASLRGDEVFAGPCGAGADLPVALDAPAVDWGLLFGGGLDVRAGPGAFTLSARYRAGLSAIASTGAEDDGGIEHRGLGVSAGYLWSLP